MEGDPWCSSLDAIPTLRSGQLASNTADADAGAVAEYADDDDANADADDNGANAEYADDNGADADAEWSLAAIPSNR